MIFFFLTKVSLVILLIFLSVVWAGGGAQAVEYLPSKHKALSSKPHTRDWWSGSSGRAPSSNSRTTKTKKAVIIPPRQHNVKVLVYILPDLLGIGLLCCPFTREEELDCCRK
jgi:hypothetical protein